MKSGIYKITNEVTGKFYIGSSKDVDFRWIIHTRHLKANTHCNPKLQHSWNFYGEDKFTFMVLERVSTDQLFIREQYYLDTFKPFVRGLGYNIGKDACGGDNITNNPNRDAFIEKMSEISSGENNPMFGRKHSEKSKKKQKTKAKGRFTLEWFIEKYGKIEGQSKYDERRLMLVNRDINYSNPNVNKGKRIGSMSDESKKKISLTKQRMKLIRNDLIDDIKSDQYSMKELCDKYNIGITSVKYHKSKIRKKLI
jgi:group I intron endonuclease